MSGTNLRAVLFDYGHTLIHFDEHPHEGLVEAYQRINHLLRDTLEREVPDAHTLIGNVSIKVDDEIQQDYQEGRPEEVEISHIYDRVLRRIGLELEPALIEQIMELEQEGWLSSVHVGDDVRPTLERIREAGLKVGLVSNAAYRPRLMRRQVEALGLLPYFDSLTFSSEVGFRKPHPRIYADALHKLQVEPATALFVGDRVREDVRGPKALGMRAVLLREWRQDDDPAGEADYTLARLGQLWPVIDALGRRELDSPDDRGKKHN
ncbi:MAG TPA: HAD family hydrolase [Candidatus Limnocylindrales bacterium]|nr:HAD family hydrolase [Candidatus Limnocylindrales bacterium]